MKSCKLFIVFFSLLISNSGNSQNVVTDSTATVVSYWDKGDIMKYSLLQKKEKYQEAKLISGGSSTSTIIITVIDASEKSYTLNWKCSQIKLNDLEVRDTLTLRLLQLVEGIDFRYKTNELGQFQELVNWEEVRNSVYLLIDKLGQQSGNSGINSALAEMKKIFSSKESIEQIILRDVQLLHNLFGGEYKLNEQITAESELPNFLGGNPFSAVLSVEMTELNRANNRCRIKMNQVVDKEKLTNELNDWMKKLGKPKDSKLPLINMTDEYDFAIELKKGIITRAYSSRVVEIDNTKSIEVHELTKL